MRRIKPMSPLQPTTLATLSTLQGSVSGPFDARVGAAKELWASKTSTQAKQAAFDDVKARLIEGCWGARRCNYCEDSRADEVEHFRPKDWFPEVAFVWENYLYACGPCNSPKSNKFPLFVPSGSTTILELERGRNDPVVAPPAGDAVLIDPRAEDPLDFLFLDIRGDLRFAPRPDIDSKKQARARETIKILHLNDRDDLVKARTTTLSALRSALMSAYAAITNPAGILPGCDPLQDAQTSVENTPHRFVWDEIVRHRRIEPYAKLFGAVHVALTW